MPSAPPDREPIGPIVLCCRTRSMGAPPAHCRASGLATLAIGVLAAAAQADATTLAPMDGSSPEQFEALRVANRRLVGRPITFSAIGDAPYGAAEIPIFLQQLEDHRRYSQAEFMVHVGDLKSGSEPCDESVYRLTAEWLRAMDLPVYVVPGDNEWVDCADPSQAWTYWTTHLMHLEQGFCDTPPTEYQTSRPENFAFVRSGVLFLGVNIVAGSPDAPMRDGAAWVEAQLEAKQGRVRAAVLFSQAGPSSSRALFFDRFVAAVAAFGRPVLLVHGDGHTWEWDSPYLVPNLTRAQLDRTVSPPAHFTVTLDAAQPFVFERDPWPPGTPVADDVPCVDAGADQIVSAQEPAYLQGRATDDGLAGALQLHWTQENGPGLVTFADASAALTTARFDRIGTYTLRLAATDGLHARHDSVVVVAADPATVPQAQDDLFVTDEDAPLVLPGPGVLANDIHGLGLPMTAVLFTPPAHGTLALAADGGFEYRSEANWFGTDTFLYQARDANGASDVATVTVVVGSVNDAPVAVNETYAIGVGTVLTQAAPGVLANDSDADGDALTVELADGVTNGTLSLHPDGSFDYTPRVDFIGTDSFVYRVGDGAAQSVALATIQVAPVTFTIAPQADAYVRSSNTTTNYGSVNKLIVEQDTRTYYSYLKFTVTGVGVSVRRARLRLYASDGGPDGGEVYPVANTFQGSTTAWTESGITWSNAPVMGGIPVATLGSVANNTWVEWDVTAAVTGNGTYSFGIQNGSTNPVEFSSREGARPPQLVIDTDLPNAPPVAADDVYDGSEDAGLTVAAPGVLANDTDDPRDVLSVSLQTPPTSGTVILQPNGAFTYTPAANFNGNVGFTYRVQDTRGGTATGSVTLRIAAVNDAPVAVADAHATDEDVPLIVPAPGVLGNDGDVEGDVLTTAVATSPTHGVLELTADGSFTYAPTANFNGSDGFTYTVSDGHGGTAVGSVAITVRAVNDPPAAGDDSYGTDEDVPLQVAAPGVLGNDGDADGDALVATVATGPANGALELAADGSFTYTPAANFNGSDTFTYTVVDSSGGESSATVAIMVRAVNDPPAAGDDSYGTDEDVPLHVATPGVLGNDGDPDGDALIATVATGPANGALELSADGSFTYTPAAGFDGSDGFTYTVADSTGGTATATVAIAVGAVNDAPAAGDDSYATDEDVPLQVATPGVLGNDGDPDGDVLIAAVATGPAHGALELAADGSFTYTPAASFNGSDTFTYTVVDSSGGESSATVAIMVRAVNDPPAAGDDSYGTDEDVPLQVAAPGVLGNDGDADGDVLTATVATGPTNGALELSADGSFIYTPAANFNGGDTFTYTVADSNGGTASATVAVTVRAMNDAPVAVDDSLGTDEDVPLQVATPGVLGNDGDPDGDVLVATVATGPAHGALELSADGSFTYTPATGFNGSDGFTYTVADSNGGTATATVSIRVAASADSAAASIVLESDSSRAADPRHGSEAEVEGIAPSLWIDLGPTGVRVHPNPFNGRTTISYDLDAVLPVDISIYNVRGQRVRQLASGVQGPGRHQVVWDGRSTNAVEVETGLYFLRIQRGGRTSGARMLLLQ